MEAYRSNGLSSETTLESPRRLALLGLTINALFWCIYLVVQWVDSGLFYFLGVDWSRFWGAARAFVAEGPAAAYQLEAISRQMQPLAAYYGENVYGLQVGPVPYPPVFLALFAPLTLIPPPVSFALWTIGNLALATFVARRLARRFEGPWASLIVPLMVLFGPVMMALFVGQMVILLLFFLYQAYRALEEGEEFRAGAWLGIFLLKPQYGVVLILVLVLKRRWAAVGGVTASALVIGLASLVVGGPGAIMAYLRMLFTSYPGFNGGLAIDPSKMIGWRSLVFDLTPGLGTTGGMLLTLLLSLATLATLPVIWRGEWRPRAPRFSSQILATMLATLLVAYHSQFHGAVLLLVPAALVIAQRNGPPLLRQVCLAGLFGFPLLALISVLVTSELQLVYLACPLLMALALMAILSTINSGELALGAEPAIVEQQGRRVRGSA